MKNKSRNIVVEGINFSYVVAPDRTRQDSLGYVRISIWNSDNRKAQKIKVYVRFDDPWLNFGPLITGDPEKIAEAFELRPITPKVLRTIIEKASATGWNPSTEGREISLEWNRTLEQLIRQQ